MKVNQSKKLQISLISFCEIILLVFIYWFALGDIGEKFWSSKEVGQAMNDYKYSFIDVEGKVVIDASKYLGVRSYSDGLAAVCLRIERWGFIDKSGKEIISPQFEQVDNYSEGMAGVKIGNKWGFIDKNGQVIIKPLYDWINSFSEGVAVVVKGNKVLIIDNTGQIHFSRSLDEIQLNIYENARYSEGLIDAYDCLKEKIGYIDKSGNFVIEPKFAQAAPFSEGLARVAMIEEGVEKLGYIDRSGHFVIPPSFNTDVNFQRNSTEFSEGLSSLSEGLRPTSTEKARFVYIDKKGDIVLYTAFFYAGPFRNGLAIVYNAEKNKWGYIDKKGNVAIPLQYDLVFDFSEGLALVAIQNP